MNLELKKLRDILASKSQKAVSDYYVPTAWNYFNYEKGDLVDKQMLKVNPYHFYQSAIDYIVNNQEPTITDYRKASYYSTMIRTNTTFDHNQSGSIEVINNQGFLETGSFVKMIAYLPTLKKMGINVVYLLPIMKFSKLDRKGELGSVYGVSDFFKIDDALFDPIVDNQMTLEQQFKAFIQACHTFGMKVILDIIPRTNSVNSSLIIDYPEWFYWIKLEDLKTYKPPKVDSLPSTTPITASNIKDVYSSSEVQEHISKFCIAPNLQDPIKWQKLKDDFKNDPNIEPLLLVREYFDLTVAPAFSDVINDTQPAWSDVTFFRLYLDHATILDELKIDVTKVPYILYDSIKGNLFPGKIKNQPLWDLLSDILPYYIKNFDLDGARTDMGHALPEELTKLIISKAKNIKNDFYFIAEELSTSKQTAINAKNLGYDLIIGDGFYHTVRIKEQLCRDFYYNGMTLPLLVFAAGETHDTPRLIARDGGIKTLKFVTILNLLAHNLVSFINSGQELLDKQPMNTGIDATAESAYILDPSDPFYGKLPLFDIYQFHYENNYQPFIEMLGKINKIRAEYIDMIIDSKCANYITTPNKDQIIFKYSNEKCNLYVIGNASLSESTQFDLHIKTYETLFTTNPVTYDKLDPLDIMIILERKQ